MDLIKISNGYNVLNSAITKIDLLIRQYPFVRSMGIVKTARLELEQASRLINAGLTEIVGINESGSVNEKHGECDIERNGIGDRCDGSDNRDEKNIDTIGKADGKGDENE